MKAVILAAGIGSRMGERARLIPKCLLEFKGEHLLSRHLRLLADEGVTRVTTVIGTVGACWTDDNTRTIRDIAQDIVINEHNRTTDNTGSLWVALEQMPEVDDLLVIDGDLSYSPDMLHQLVTASHSTILTKPSFDSNETRNRIVHEQDIVLDIGTHIPLTSLDRPYYVYGAAMRIVASDYELFRATVKEIVKDVTDPDALSMIRVLAKLATETTVKYLAHEEWFNMNTPEIFAEAETKL